MMAFNNIEEPLDIINNIKKKRKEISNKVKNSLWKKYNKNLNSKCYVCNKNITAFNFQVGHIISITNGGTDNISNLRSICGGCNLSIGIHNLEHYKNNNSDIVSFCKDNFLNFDLMCGDCPQRIFGVIYEHFIN